MPGGRMKSALAMVRVAIAGMGAVVVAGAVYRHASSCGFTWGPALVVAVVLGGCWASLVVTA